MILDQFYEVLLARLGATVPELLHIDLYRQQYDNPPLDDEGNTMEDPFPVPAGFIQWPNTFELKPLGMRRKTAEITFGLHVVQNVIGEVSKRTKPAIRAKSHQHKILVDKIQAAIEGFNGFQVTSGYNQFDAISWVGMNPYIFLGSWVVDILWFKVKLTSDNSRITYTQLQALTPPVVANDIIESEFDDLDPETI